MLLQQMILRQFQFPTSECFIVDLSTSWLCSKCECWHIREENVDDKCTKQRMTALILMYSQPLTMRPRSSCCVVIVHSGKSTNWESETFELGLGHRLCDQEKLFYILGAAIFNINKNTIFLPRGLFWFMHGAMNIFHPKSLSKYIIVNICE